MKEKIIIGVIGSSTCSSSVSEVAYIVGKEIARKNAILICGGRGGVMEAACKGAKEEKGITIGVLPGNDKESANPYIDIPIVTGMGEARNVIIARSSDAVIAIAGKYGTLSEIAFALRFDVPVVGIATWNINIPILKAKNPKQAVGMALSAIRKTRGKY
ncbi:MAG: TIGR00725 family protein [Candidatus Cloacimonadota bacterium]|nr:MAG: TIGR00725 family protein [Candidatus Cloacimonadota bacterium]